MGIEKELKNLTPEEELNLTDLIKLFLTEVVDLQNRKVRTDASLTTGDIQIGAVEIKDDTADTRSNVEVLGVGALSPTLKALIVKAKAFLSDASGTIISPAKEDGNLALIKAKTDNLDVALDTIAKEVTLLLIKAKTDNLDVAISTIAKEVTLLLIKAKTDNLDVALSTVAKEVTLLLIKAKTDNIPPLGQAVKAASAPMTIASDQDALPIKHQDSVGNGLTSKDETGGVRSLDVNIRSGGAGFEVVGVKDTGDTRINPAKEDGNLASIKTNTDKLNVNLSTIASQSTVSSIDTKTPALGQAAKVASSPVVLASDQDSVPVKVQDGTGNNLTSKDEGGGVRSLDMNIRSEKKNVSVFSSNNNSLVASAQTITTAIAANKQINLITVQFVTLTTKVVRVGFWDGVKFWLIKEDLAFKLKDIVITDIIRTNMEIRAYASQTAGDAISVKVEYEL